MLQNTLLPLRTGVYALCLALICQSVLANVLLAAETAPQIRIVIDYGDGVEKHFTALPWKEGMTVFDAMQAAKSHPRGVTFRHRGSGATAFLLQIDDKENQGREGNWVYRVNDKLAERSFGAQELKAGDAVLWKFEKPL